LLQSLTDRGWLDDRRFALSYVRYRAQTGRYGRRRIERELRRRGVAGEWIGEALADALPGEEEERELLRKRLDRRLRGKTPPYAGKLLRALYASLLRAGFPSAIIRDELFSRARQALPDDLEEKEGT
jgi:regulatory protein